MLHVTLILTFLVGLRLLVHLITTLESADLQKGMYDPQEKTP